MVERFEWPLNSSFSNQIKKRVLFGQQQHIEISNEHTHGRARARETEIKRRDRERERDA